MVLFRLALLSLWTLAARGQSNNAGIVRGRADLEMFAKLLDTLGISPGLGDTIFAPNNDAFASYAAAEPILWEKYQQAEFFLHLRDLMLWHLITEDKYTTDQIFDGTRNVMANSLGNMTIYQSVQTLDGTPRTAIVDANITTSDGIIHVVDQFIVSPYISMYLIQQMLDDQSPKFAFSTMANLALYVGLDDEINKIYDNGVTMLVPPNRRFNRAEIDVPSLLTDKMKEYTRDFILCHLILDNYYESSIFAMQQEQNIEQMLVKTFLGTHMWITTSDDRLRFQSIDVVLPDQVARNGVFHGIDFPLFPPFCSDFARFTPLSTTWDTSDYYRFFISALISSEDIALMFNTTLSVFAPTREAFALFNNEDFNRLVEPIWVRHATEFLMNHISSPARTLAQWAAEAPGSITMLNGQTYELKRNGPDPRIRNGNEQGKAVFGDLIALDGYLHIIDSVITPTAVSQSIYDQSQNNPSFSLLVENIDFVDLTDIVDRDSPLTMLAPNNRAFTRVTFGTLEGGDIIRSHIFRGLLFTDVIANLTQMTSVSGVTHGVETRGMMNESIYVGGAYIYKGDMLARNGVLHYVDRVIGLDYPTIPPSTSPAPTVTPEPTMYMPPTVSPVYTPTGQVDILLPPVPLPDRTAGSGDTQHKLNEKGASAASGTSMMVATVASCFALLFFAVA